MNPPELGMHSRPRITPALARKLDHLATRAHAFHRFAHHPLCDRYAGELIALGRRRRVCRGCAYAAGGALTGSILAGFTSLDAAAFHVAFALATIALGVAAMSVGRHRASASASEARRSKLWTRALPSASLACAFVLCFRVQDVRAGWLGLGILTAVAVLRRMYRDRGPDRSPCVHCPERRAVPCSGFRDIVRAERAFVRRSQVLLDRAASRRVSS